MIEPVSAILVAKVALGKWMATHLAHVAATHAVAAHAAASTATAHTIAAATASATPAWLLHAAAAKLAGLSAVGQSIAANHPAVASLVEATRTASKANRFWREFVR